MDLKITLEDLSFLVFRVQEDDSAKWVTIDAAAATDLQFNAWARSQIAICGDVFAPWSLVERVAFCNILFGYTPFQPRYALIYDEDL